MTGHWAESTLVSRFIALQLEKRVAERTAELVQANEALRESEDLLAEAQRVAGVGSWRWNIQTGEVRWSDELYAIYGVSPETFQPSIRAFADYIHPDDRELVQKRVEQLATSDQPLDLDFRIIAANGSTRILKVVGQIVEFDDKRKPLTVIGVNQDITAQRQAEEERERLLAQARRDAETKTVLLREVNHRVKNNLEAIIGLLYAQMDRPGAEKQPEYQAALLEVTRRIEGLAIVHGMLSASQWAPLRLDELAERIVGTTLQSFPGGLKAMKVQPSPVLVSPDQAHTLALILNELALNFGKYVLPAEAHAQVTVSSRVEDGNVVLAFRDGGRGYPPEALAGQWSGGLELLRNLVTRNLRGQLALRNENGALAEIRFPVAQG